MTWHWNEKEGNNRVRANKHQHGVDTAKYYAQAERELAAEAASKN